MSFLRHLKNHLEDKGSDNLPFLELVDRMIERVESEGLDERDLIIKALVTLEQAEAKQTYEALEIATRDRRELSAYFKEAIQQAVAQRDALHIRQLQRLQNLLDEPPETTRRIDQQTVDLALELLVRSFFEQPRPIVLKNSNDAQNETFRVHKPGNFHAVPETDGRKWRELSLFLGVSCLGCLREVTN